MDETLNNMCPWNKNCKQVIPLFSLTLTVDNRAVKKRKRQKKPPPNNQTCPSESHILGLTPSAQPLNQSLWLSPGGVATSNGTGDLRGITLLLVFLFIWVKWLGSALPTQGRTEGGRWRCGRWGEEWGVIRGGRVFATFSRWKCLNTRLKKMPTGWWSKQYFGILAWWLTCSCSLGWGGIQNEGNS